MFETYWQQRTRCKIRETIAYVLPALIYLGLLAAYLISPDFYLTYLLESSQREYQAVELATFAFALGSTATLGWAAVSMYRSTTQARERGLISFRPGLAGAGDGRGGAIIVAVVALATLFLALEEINWGQTFLHWGTPDFFKSDATNLHNNIPKVQTLGSLFVSTVLWLIPLLWWMRPRIRLPQDWAPAIAEGPVIIALLVAYIPSEVKWLYRYAVPDYEHQAIYINYLEELKEQKEMLVALSLMIYGIYRVFAARTLARVVAQLTGAPRT